MQAIDYLVTSSHHQATCVSVYYENPCLEVSPPGKKWQVRLQHNETYMYSLPSKGLIDTQKVSFVITSEDPTYTV